MDDKTPTVESVTQTQDSPDLPLGDLGADGAWKTAEKTHAEEVADAKKANHATEVYLRGRPLADQRVKGATKLSKVAPRIFAAVRANPPDWLPEFDRFVKIALGPRPSESFRHQAAMEWDCAVMFGILCFGHLADMLADEEEEDDAPTVGPVADAVDVSGGIAPADVGDVLVDPREGESVAPVVGGDVLPPATEAGFKGSALILGPGGETSDTFAILGADGEPVVEGCR